MAGKITVGKYTRLAVERHVNDLKKKDFKYYFDPDKAEYVIDFFRFAKHVEGACAGEPLNLEPYQQFIIAMVFGWLRKDNGKRRFLKAYESVAKKNGKTTKNSVLALFMAVADGEAGSQVFTAATKHKQGAITFNLAKAIIEKSSELGSIFEIRQFSIIARGTNSFFQPLGTGAKGDMDTEDGLNVHCALIDEYHAHKNRKVYEIMDSGTAARIQPLTYMITTAGKDKDVPCYKEEEYAKDVLAGKRDNDRYFSIIFTLDDEDLEGDNWKNPDVWEKSNPVLNHNPYSTEKELLFKQNFKEIMEAQFNKDCASLVGINEFKTKRLNIWTQTEVVWIRDEDYTKCMHLPYDISKFKKKQCYGGLDLSTTTDLTSMCLVFPPDDKNDIYTSRSFFWMAQETIKLREKVDRVQYEEWVQEGWIVATPGKTISYEWVERQIYEVSEEYELCQLAYDRYNMNDLAARLKNNGIECFEYSQGIVAMSPPSKDYEKKILETKLAVGLNPVLRWNVSCTAVYSDMNGNIKPVKPDRMKSSKRIDGVIAHIMALDLAVINTPEELAYKERGVLFI